MIRTSFVIAMVLASGLPAAAQGAPPLAGLDRSPDWALGTAPKAARKPRRPAPGTPAPSPEAADRAARLAAARRKFFAGKPDGPPSTAIPEFGGYDGRLGVDGSLRPGAMFKF